MFLNSQNLGYLPNHLRQGQTLSMLYQCGCLFSVECNPKELKTWIPTLFFQLHQMGNKLTLIIFASRTVGFHDGIWSIPKYSLRKSSFAGTFTWPCSSFKSLLFKYIFEIISIIVPLIDKFCQISSVESIEFDLQLMRLFSPISTQCSLTVRLPLEHPRCLCFERVHLHQLLNHCCAPIQLASRNSQHFHRFASNTIPAEAIFRYHRLATAKECEVSWKCGMLISNSLRQKKLFIFCDIVIYEKLLNNCLDTWNLILTIKRR